VFLFLGNVCASRNPEDRAILINNLSGRRFDIYWIHPQTNEKAKQSQSSVMHGATFALNSFVSHAFEAIEVPNARTDLCSGKNGACRSASFAVTESHNQVINILKKFSVEHHDDVSRARAGANEVTSSCEKTALSYLDSDDNFNEKSARSVVDEMKECVQQGVAGKIEELNGERNFQASIRTSMGQLIEDYTCKDHSLNTTTPIETKNWRGIDGKMRNVQIMVERDYAKIHVVKNFISEDECRAIKDQVGSHLYAATVANENGGSTLSPNRKAKQGSIAVPWHLEGSGNVVTKVGRRIFEYTNHATDYNLDVDGQEDLMIIKYNGRGPDDKEPDRYMPHCDGDCTGQPQKTGNRVATMVLYCDVPEVGGATNFRNSNIHVKPEKGNSIFFSYMGSDKVMDNGFTEHSGCPVIEGQKLIITQWMRYGVDAENPWDSFNTLGVKITSEENDDSEGNGNGVVDEMDDDQGLEGKETTRKKDEEGDTDAVSSSKSHESEQGSDAHILRRAHSVADIASRNQGRLRGGGVRGAIKLLPPQ